jgi:hypothetical protein
MDSVGIGDRKFSNLIAKLLNFARILLPPLPGGPKCDEERGDYSGKKQSRQREA